MTDGLAYVFLRRDGAPLPTGCAGHVGWGFTSGDGRYYYGATENGDGGPIVLPGNANGWWAEEGSEADMMAAMKSRNYDGYKVASVRNASPEAARVVADGTKGAGYFFLRNNCLDHAFQVAYAYGVLGMPWRETHPSPNDWFAVFNGEFGNL